MRLMCSVHMETTSEASVEHCLKRMLSEQHVTAGNGMSAYKFARLKNASFDAEQVIMALPDRMETRQFFPAAVAAGFAWRVLRQVVQKDSVHPILIYQLCASCPPPDASLSATSALLDGSCPPPAASLSSITVPLTATPPATVRLPSLQGASPAADQSVLTSGSAGVAASNTTSAATLSADGKAKPPNSIRRVAPRQLLLQVPEPHAVQPQHLQQQQRSQVGTCRYDDANM